MLGRAPALDTNGGDFDQLIAAQLRLPYHGFRGEAEQVRRAYELMEQCTIQAGSEWQVENWSAATSSDFGRAGAIR